MKNFHYVGFPRSGSHWIRLVLEDYTDGKSTISSFLKSKDMKTLLTRINNGEFNGTHDLDLSAKHKNVIYLYRNPVDCIYSYLSYENFSLNDKEVFKAFKLWSDNVNKWCFDETFTEHKIIICYENLMKNFNKEFSKLILGLELEVNNDKLNKCIEKYDKKTIKDIVHDKKVIIIDDKYEGDREWFRGMYYKPIVEKLSNRQKSLWNDLEWF